MHTRVATVDYTGPTTGTITTRDCLLLGLVSEDTIAGGAAASWLKTGDETGNFTIALGVNFTEGMSLSIPNVYCKGGLNWNNVVAGSGGQYKVYYREL